MKLSDKLTMQQLATVTNMRYDAIYRLVNERKIPHSEMAGRKVVELKDAVRYFLDYADAAEKGDSSAAIAARNTLLYKECKNALQIIKAALQENENAPQAERLPSKTEKPKAAPLAYSGPDSVNDWVRVERVVDGVQCWVNLKQVHIIDEAEADEAWGCTLMVLNGSTLHGVTVAETAQELLARVARRDRNDNRRNEPATQERQYRELANREIKEHKLRVAEAMRERAGK